MKQAILVTSFGTSYPETRKKTIDAIEREIAAAFPDREVRRAFTSSIIRRILRERDGAPVDSVTEALERLLADGYADVIVQPTHIIPGKEYHDIAGAVQEYAHRFQRLRLGPPLLLTAKDYQKIVQIVWNILNVEQDAALCLMGHGSEHPADVAYAALNYHFCAQGHDNVFVGTVEGYPDFAAVLDAVKRLGVKKVRLAPLMVVAGDHAVNDMAGDGESSWQSLLAAQGYDVQCVLRGLGEYPAVRRMYVEHVKALLEQE